jgi:hypothetical protein
MRAPVIGVLTALGGVLGLSGHAWAQEGSTRTTSVLAAGARAGYSAGVRA